MASAMQPLEAVKAMGLAGQWRIAAHERQILEQMCEVSTEELMTSLLPQAQQLATAPISEFYVGAVLLSDAGNLYFGANQEFSGQAINAAIHAEQCGLCNLFHDGQKKVVSITVTDAPCGHCRQFLAETAEGLDMRVLVGDKKPLTLTELLPHAFVPADLDNAQPLLAHPRQRLEAAGAYDTVVSQANTTGLELALTKAIVAASFSYAPYSGSYAAVTMGLKDGRVIEGRYLENAAFNPALPPAQSALIQLLVNGASVEDVECIVLAEVVQDKPQVSHKDSTVTLLREQMPQATIIFQPLQPAKIVAASE
jgi:cytidine deaminase